MAASCGALRIAFFSVTTAALASPSVASCSASLTVEVSLAGPAEGRTIALDWEGSSQMSKYALVATIEAADGRMGELMPLLMAHRARCLKYEAGTLQFDFLVPHDDKTKVLLFEVYVDEAAFQVYWQGASIALFREQASGMVAKMTATRGSIAE